MLKDKAMYHIIKYYIYYICGSRDTIDIYFSHFMLVGGTYYTYTVDPNNASFSKSYVLSALRDFDKTYLSGILLL